METQQTLFKGELMEELLRYYFLEMGYFVARGVKFQYQNMDVTDIDLFLYGRPSSLTRERINVDIKNKKTPQAFERIVWANGLMRILNLDSCIVATTDSKPIITSFAQSMHTMVLDGKFLNKIKSITNENERISEEDLLNELSKYKSYKTYNNKSWKYIYEFSKSRLLTELDYSGFNSSIMDLNYFITKYIADEQRRAISLGMVYVILAHTLIIMDFILKDIAFLEQKDRESKLSIGLKYGNLGKEGIDKIISMAMHISGVTSANTIMKSLDSIPVDILKDFFSKNENAKKAFGWAKELSILAFSSTLIYPNEIESSLKGVLSVILDFLSIDRKTFFETK